MSKFRFDHLLAVNTLGRYFNRAIVLVTLLFIGWSFTVAISKLRDGPLSNVRVIAQEQRVDKKTFTKIETFLDSLRSPVRDDTPSIRDPFTAP